MAGQERVREIACDLFETSAQRVGADDDDIATAHFGEDGDGVGACEWAHACAAAGVDCEACGGATRKANGSDEWVVDKCIRGGVVWGSIAQVEQRCVCVVREAREELACAWVGWMFFDDDGAASGEGAGGVAAADAVGEGEVGCAEDGDEAQGHEAREQVVRWADGGGG